MFFFSLYICWYKNIIYYMIILFFYAEVKQIFLTWFYHYSSAHALVDGWNYTGSCFLGRFLFLMLLKTIELSLPRILEYWNTCSEYWITEILARSTEYSNTCSEYRNTGWWETKVLTKEDVRRRPAEGRTLWDDWCSWSCTSHHGRQKKIHLLWR